MYLQVDQDLRNLIKLMEHRLQYYAIHDFKNNGAGWSVRPRSPVKLEDISVHDTRGLLKCSRRNLQAYSFQFTGIFQGQLVGSQSVTRPDDVRKLF
jgi:hypothetical protein